MAQHGNGENDAPGDVSEGLTSASGSTVRRERSTAVDPPVRDSAAFFVAPTVPGERPGDMIGPYKLLSILGEGGFGVVWLAERREPHVQRVALKIIKPGMDSKAVIARFEQERQALAVMDHPNVAKVFDAGATPMGRPYFVMEHVQGEPITEYCDRHTYTIKQRLELFIPVCEAVQHAHHKGIIHRDIKPSNILVTVAAEGGAVIPKVIDFGIAKAISKAMTEKTIFTEQGLIIGTPEYMSPEQTGTGPTDIDTRTDVYSLGVVLYELLTGSLPFDSAMLRSKNYTEIQRIICEVDPPTPSTRLSGIGQQAQEIARQRQLQVDALARELRNELEWIPLKAMRKERAERYGTPLELSDDIHRYLASEPLIAGPESRSYRVRKFVRRNRTGILVGSMIAASLLAGTIVSIGFAISEKNQRRQVVREIGRVNAVKSILGSAMGTPTLREAGSDAKVTDALAIAVRGAEALVDAQPDICAFTLEEVAKVYLGLGDAEQTIRLMQRVIELREGPARSTNAEVLKSHLFFEFTRGVSGDFSGLENFQTLVANFEKEFGTENVETVVCKVNYSTVLFYAGRIDEAREILTQALPVLRNLPMESVAQNDQLAMALSNLGMIDLIQGQVQEGLTLLQRAVEMNRGAGASRRFDLAMSLDGLGQALQDTDDLAGAEAAYRESLTLKEQLLGPHAMTFLTMSNLGNLCSSLKRHEEAAALLENAVAGFDQIGNDGEFAMNALWNLSAIRFEQGRYAEAIPLMERVLQGRLKFLSDDHPEVTKARKALEELNRRLNTEISSTSQDTP